MKNLYPLKFNPIFIPKIWGSSQLKKIKKKFNYNKIGESWEISSLPKNSTIIKNGIYKGLKISDLIKKFDKNFLGIKVYKKFGNQFPLLIKFLSTSSEVSIQVHPDNVYAKKYHNSLGKNEMWYIVDAAKNSQLIIGFNQNINRIEFLKKISEDNLNEILNYTSPKKGDVYMIPAQTIHGIGKNLLIIEIQQASDLTYRIYDYNRIENKIFQRKLHLKKALEVINLKKTKIEKINYKIKSNNLIKLIDSEFFIIKKLILNSNINLKFSINSFTILIVIEGELIIKTNNLKITIEKGETILFPAILNEFNIKSCIEKSQVLIVRIFE